MLWWVAGGPTIWNLHLSVANQLAGEEGLSVSMLNEFVLHHLHHAKSRLERQQGGEIKLHFNQLENRKPPQRDGHHFYISHFPKVLPLCFFNLCLCVCSVIH